MKAMPYDAPGPGAPAPDAPAPDASEEDWGGYDEEEDQEFELPRRPRRRFFNPWTAAALAVVLGAIGFYVGVRVEKSQLASSTSTSPFSAAAGTGTGTAAARTGTGTTGTSTSGASGAGGGGAFRSLFGGAGGAAGSATIGTVSSISGDTLYVTETSGNMVKVTLSSATKVSKSVTVGKGAVRPGDLVTVAGAKSSDGTVSATTVNDTGASPLAALSGGSGSSSTGSSASSAVGSLFGGG